MFGIGFTEILLIAVIAILFLGPDKLPETMVQIAKFIKSVKKTVGEAKDSLEEEMKIADLKDEALNYKKQLDSATNELKSFKNIDMNDIIDHEEPHKEKSVKKEDTHAEASTTPIEAKNDTVTFKKKSKKSKKSKVKKEKSDSKTKGDA